VITGEEIAWRYTNSGSFKIGDDDLIFLFTDGFEHYFELPELLELFKAWPADLEVKLKNFTRQKSKTDSERFGHERTLIVIKINQNIFMKIVITGAAGIIGSVLMKYLPEKHDVVGIDKKAAPGVLELDLLKSPGKFKQIIRGTKAIIHLAWDTRENTDKIKPIISGNKEMGELVYELALEQKVGLIILASSVHAALGLINQSYPDFTTDAQSHRGLHKKKITVQDGLFPLGAYGASKVYLEVLGRAYSLRGLQVIVVRFGNVTPDNGHGEYPFWLSHRDCCQFIDKCVSVKNLPKFNILYAISSNECNPFDISEAKKILSYAPQDGSGCPFKK